MPETPETVELIFSRDRRLYYVKRLDHHRPRSWVAVEQGEDGKYDVLPFAFHEVKSGDTERRPLTDPLVVRYAQAEEWPPRRSIDWHEGMDRARRAARDRRDEQAEELRRLDAEIARLDAAFDAHPVIGGPA
jgi:hypothetical protein